MSTSHLSIIMSFPLLESVLIESQGEEKTYPASSHSIQGLEKIRQVWMSMHQNNFRRLFVSKPHRNAISNTSSRVPTPHIGL
ncbi:hypothetical protein NPIL_110511 [Nephila pilipes]|uniref:Uncharacterized protein n=1 Tax=Nephila pilipes TaxID=299642 RepID=A0A8X6URL7_NEPPI|nr:hypothetical protein NPIL_110511 [Nephila pilipes]